jgi:hypothetical protein
MATVPTPVVSELLQQLRNIYSEYTGYQIAECIKIIRQEITQQKEDFALEEEIAMLTLKLKK